MAQISIVVPCCNEEETIGLFYEKTVSVLSGLSKEWEIIFVDDGSKDTSLTIMKDIAKKDERVKYISLSRNFGKEAAMYAGMNTANGDYVAVMDVDLQDPPEVLAEMIDILDKHPEYDCVGSRRTTRAGEPPVRTWFAKRFYELINSISETKMQSGVRDFRLMRRYVVDVILSMGEGNRFSKGLFSWVGFNVKWLEYENVERSAGKTKWNFWKLFRYAIEGIVDFSSAPLNISFIIAVLFGVFSIVCIALHENMAVLICAVGTLCSVQIGIMGLYVGRIYKETKQRPIYVVKETNASNNPVRRGK